MHLTQDGPSDVVVQSDGPGDTHILNETAHWLRSFLTRTHPDLGRKGAVCPFMEQSLKMGRTALSSVEASTRTFLRDCNVSRTRPPFLTASTNACRPIMITGVPAYASKPPK